MDGFGDVSCIDSIIVDVGYDALWFNILVRCSGACGNVYDVGGCFGVGGEDTLLISKRLAWYKITTTVGGVG